MTFLLFSFVTVSGQDLNQLHISEFMADNASTLADEDSDYSDWIELYNPTTESIDIGGWYLSDNPDNLIKWIFPSSIVDANSYLLIFASGKDKNTNELHSNFKLSASGESILLTKPDGLTIQHQWQFPPQMPDISFGYIDGEMRFLDQPTPKAANLPGTFLSKPVFSADHGFFDALFSLVISSHIEGSSIYYTTDGSDPTTQNGLLYEAPLMIDSNTVIRAIVEKDGAFSATTTKTFIFPAKVKDQVYHPEGYPHSWGAYSRIEGNAPADYAMDPEVCEDPQYRDLLVPALTSIPTISLSTNKDFLFSHSTDPATGGIYIHTAETSGAEGHDWERPVSVEYMLPDGSKGFQVDCGVRIHGGASRVPEKNPKHSFRLAFRGEYGPKELKYPLFDETATSSFNGLVLRAGFNQTWLHWDDPQREAAQYINDSWVKDTYSTMGRISAHNKFVHLYINGLYWGLYNICERMDDDFMDYYLDGGKDDFDVIKDYAELAEGNKDAWNQMMDLAATGLSDAASYYAIQGKDEFGNDDPSKEAYLDVNNLIDYMLLNFYIGNRDWDHHNWIAARNRRNPGKGFQFFPWDSERTFNGVNDKMVEENNENRPSFLYSQLRKNPLFRIEFAERANELLGPKGLLGPESVAANWQRRVSEIDLAIIAESARWGDYRRDVHSYKNEPYELYTKNGHWIKEQERLMNDYFPKRSQIVLEQLRDLGLAGDIITDIEQDNDDLQQTRHHCFPNPFSEVVTIRLSSQDSGQMLFEVLDIKGKNIIQLDDIVASDGYVETRWKPKGYGNGLYFYRIITDKAVFTGKMIYRR